MTKVIAFCLLATFSLVCHSRDATDADLFSAAILVADNARVGTIDEIKPRDPSDQLGYFDVIVGTSSGAVDLVSDDPSFDKKYSKGKARFVFLTREYKTPGGNERRLLLPFPWAPLYPIPESGSIDVDSIRAKAHRVASEYLNTAVCEESYRKTVTALTGKDAQRVIRKMYDSRPLKAGQLACLVEALKSTKPTKVRAIEVPWKSREGVYYVNFPGLGRLVGILIPHLMNFPAPMDERLPSEKVELAWGYWGAVGSQP